MDAETAGRATDPFFTTRQTRVVGLGLPLLRQAAEAAGGGLSVASQPGTGTRVDAVFGLGHVDRAPLGDVETTVLVLLASHPDVDLDWTHRRGAHGVQPRHGRPAGGAGRRVARVAGRAGPPARRPSGTAKQPWPTPQAADLERRHQP